MKKSTRIAIIDSKHKWGGVATWNLNIVKGIVAKGFDTILIARHGGLNLMRYSQHIQRVYDVIFGPDYNPLAIWKLRRIFRKNHISHVIVNVQKEIINAGIAARMAGCKIILRIGSVRDFKTRKKTERLFNRYVDQIIVPCLGMKNELCHIFEWLNPDDLSVIYNGKSLLKSPDLRIIEKLRKVMGLKPDHFLIGYIGQISKTKNLSILISAFSTLLKQNSHLRLLIVGEGPEKEAVKDLALSLGILPFVIFTGYVEDIEKFLSIIEIGILTSESEGFPNTILEYMMAGIPIVASNVGCIPEAIEDNENGLLFESNNVDQLIDSLQKLISSKELRNKFAQSSLVKVDKVFNKDNMISSFIDILEQR